MPTKYYGYQLTESQIRYACENTTSNSDAAKWLHVSFDTWRKYAKSYIDEATGKTLYELHKHNGANKRLLLPKSRYKKKASAPWRYQPTPMSEIFENKHPKFDRRRFRDRLVAEGWKQERCDCCGFQERRPGDLEVPLRINWLDGNDRNYALENIEFLCFNCYFINVGSLHGVNKHYKIDEATGEIVPANRKDPKKIRNQVVKIGVQTKNKEK
jgi:hypothetical protein